MCSRIACLNILHVPQLKMFDLNGDGKLGLSEMARSVCDTKDNMWYTGQYVILDSMWYRAACDTQDSIWYRTVYNTQDSMWYTGHYVIHRTAYDTGQYIINRTVCDTLDSIWYRTVCDTQHRCGSVFDTQDSEFLSCFWFEISGFVFKPLFVSLRLLPVQENFLLKFQVRYHIKQLHQNTRCILYI